MYLIFLLLILNKFAKADDDSNESKYIDLLPEKEKEEFLQRIARRILADVKTKDDRDKYDGEISDDELNTHHDFVKKILQEESDNLRRNDVKEKDKEVEKDNPEESLKVKSIETVKVSMNRDDDDDKYIDLTLRHGRRDKRNENSKEISVEVRLDKVPENENIVEVNNTKSTDVKDQKEPVNINETSTIGPIETVNVEDTDLEDIQIRSFTIKSDNETKFNTNSEKPVTTVLSELNETQLRNFETLTPENIQDNNNITENESELNTSSISPNGDDITNDADFNKVTEESTLQDITESSTNAIDHESVEITYSSDNIIENVNTTENALSIIDDNEKELERNVSTILEDVTESNSRRNFYNNVTEEVEKEANSSENITEGNSRENINNSKTDVQSDTERTTVNLQPNTSIDNNSVEKVIDENIATKSTQDNTTNEIDTVSTINIEIDNLTTLKNIENPIDALKLPNNTSLNQTVQTIDGNTESTIIHISSNFTSNDNENKVESPSEKPATESIINVSSLKSVPSNFTTNANANINKDKSPNDNTDKHVATTVKYDINVKNTKNILRNGLILQKKHTETIKPNGSGKNEEEHSNNNLREYNVFEVPRGEDPFQKKGPLTNLEQPYYVPVYNYEPNNAYFNAHNRLGPNANHDYEEPNQKRVKQNPEDENSKDGGSFESDYFFDSKERGHRKFRFGFTTKAPKNSKRPKTKNRPLPLVISHPKYSDIYFNPNDYLDMDYSFSRMKRVDKESSIALPDSSSESHPYNSVGDHKLKDHLRAVRMILWQQNKFENIPPKKYKYTPIDEGSSMEGTLRYFRSLKDIDAPNTKQSDKNIAVDYYFGRMLNDKVEKVGYIKQNNKTKDVVLKIDEIPPNNVIKDIKFVKFNGRQYKDDEVLAVTPHTYLLKDLSVEEDKILEKPIKRYSIFPNPSGKDGRIDTVAKVANISDTRDVFTHIRTMLSMKVPITRTGSDVGDVYVNVLNEMVEKDDVALQRYDWLGSTVDVRAALTKLMDLTKALQERAILDSLDIELLNYTMFLHKSAKELILRDLANENRMLRKKELLPRNKKKRKAFLKEKGLLHRAWLLRKKRFDEINEFKQLLYDFQYYLYDLHEAIKNIALITKYRDQKWYDSLKRVYLTSDRKTLLEVILHLTTTRLLGLIEESAKNGVENDYIGYILTHQKEVDKTLSEFIFVLKIIEELKNIEN